MKLINNIVLVVLLAGVFGTQHGHQHTHGHTHQHTHRARHAKSRLRKMASRKYVKKSHTNVAIASSSQVEDLKVSAKYVITASPG